MSPSVFMVGLFFMWGFLTCLNDILLPHLKALFHLDYTQASLVQFAFFSAYFLFALPCGKLLSHFGYKKALALGLAIAGFGALLFYPAASFASYPVFLLALFVLAGGITLLQVAANPLVTLLGERSTSVRRLNLTQAFNSLGTTLAPWFGSYFILAGANPDASVSRAYIGIAVLMFALFVLACFIKYPSSEDLQATKSFSIVDVLKQKRLVLGVFAIFFYVGAEVAIGSYLISFLGQSNILGINEEHAARYVSLYWGGAMVGRFIGVNLMYRIKPEKLLAIFALVNVALLLTTICSSGQTAMVSILAIGLFNSIMFPTIFGLAITDLGEQTSAGSSVLVMAVVGGALLPVVQGRIADMIGLQYAFSVPVLCYIYIFIFGLWNIRHPRAIIK